MIRGECRNENNGAICILPVSKRHVDVFLRYCYFSYCVTFQPMPKLGDSE